MEAPFHPETVASCHFESGLISCTLRPNCKTRNQFVVKIFDPVGSGLVASLSRPGGNVTGMSVMETELWPKRLELLREAVPAASHVAAVHPRSNPASPSLPGLGALTFFIRETE